MALSLLAASAFAACATSEESLPQVNVSPAPEGAKPEGVSIFGIFRNGRMSPEAWEDFGKVLSTPFSQGICKAAYDVVFTNANSELADAIDDYTKENGVSDELLEEFAPLAKGDTILLLAIDGHCNLMRDEREDIEILLRIPDSFGIGLDDENTEWSSFQKEGNAEPIHARFADRDHFAPRNEVVEDFSRGKQWLPAPQDILCQSAFHFPRRRGTVAFVDEIGKREHVFCRVLDCNIEIASG